MAEWLLRLKFGQDKHFRYRLFSRTVQRPKQAEPTPPTPAQMQSIELILEQRVLRVEDDGTGHVISISTPQIPNGEKMRTVVYQHLGLRGETLQASTPHQGSAFCFPEGAVEIGSTWAGSTQNYLPNLPEPITMNYHYKVEAEEAVGERTCLRISFASDEVQFTMPLPDGSGTSHVTTSTRGLMFFDTHDGCLAKLQLTSVTNPRVATMVFEVINESEQVLI